MKRLRAIGFDLDNTLYDQTQHMLSFFRVAADHVAGYCQAPAHEIEALFVQTLARRTSYYSRLFDDVLDVVGVKDKDVVRALISLYHRHRTDLTLFDGVRELLDRLRSRFSLFLITDGNADMQRGKIQSLSLDGSFDAVVLTGAYGKEWAKPSQHAYRHVLDKLGGDAAEYLYVGDNPLCDFYGARQLGMRTARVYAGPFAAHDGESAQHAAEFALQQTIDLERLLDELEAVR